MNDYRKEAIRREWLMLAAASLAGGSTPAKAAENADMILRTAEARYPEPEESDNREG